MMYGWNGGWGVWGWVLMALMMLIFWGGVVTVVILPLRRGRGSEPPWPHGTVSFLATNVRASKDEYPAGRQGPASELVHRRTPVIIASVMPRAYIQVPQHMIATLPRGFGGEQGRPGLPGTGIRAAIGR